MQPGTLFNPFPGLRPFEPDEDHLFFGREKEIDELLRQLGSHRFLSVVGTSGSGKSSLVRSGLIPSLYSGFMVKASSSWRVSILRPGEDPIGHLAEALDAPDVIGDPGGRLGTTNRVVLDATLRRGTLGLVDAIRQARISPDENVLILVDQFEELFRFRRSRHIENSRDEAVAFVKLLLEAADQSEVPIYVVLTMRSDFIGDCMEYPGLPEAINDSLYLVPRMTRDELRSAITGPVAVAGGQIAPSLVRRLLNEVGDDQDQLPLMQHVLMRTWDHWRAHQPSAAIDLGNYEAVGTLRQALSLHAEEAYRETGSEENQRITERIFRALTDTFSDPRGVRRPTSVADLAAICETSETTITQLVEIFRRPGRSFLMPPSTVPLTSGVIVDLSHESLMRCWTRLIEWARQERASAALYTRLSQEASWFEEGAAGLWGDPELELGLRWKRENAPTAAWARRYDETFDRAMLFLERSEKERDRIKAERHAQRVRNLQIAWGSAGVLLVMFVIALVAAVFARSENQRAEANLRLAKNAVDEMLLATDRDPARLGADVPEMDEFRRELLGRARRFYAEFIRQKPDNEALRNEMAFAHFQLGHISRMLEDPQEAGKQYQEAIAEFDSLARNSPAKPEYRQALANSYNWWGETLRPLSDQYAAAEKAYASALHLQMELVRADPQNATYQQELARTHYNRGILSGSVAAPGEPAFHTSEADLREAIRLLEPLAQTGGDPQPRQELARGYNNLANLVALEAPKMAEGRTYYEKAIRLHEELVAKDPRNREYMLELAKFFDNLAELSREMGNVPSAVQANSRALALIDELARSAPSLAIEQADAHNLRGRILQTQGSPEAADEYRKALSLFEDVAGAQDVSRRSDFHQRFGDLLVNVASLRREQPNNDTLGQTLSQCMHFYAEFARQAAASGSRAAAQNVLENLSRLLPELIDRDRQTLTAPFQDLYRALEKVADRRYPAMGELLRREK
jgi:tetratricopeptide (TPR) repeat protein